MRTQTRNGFSLPEVMVGVAIVGILAVASVPNITSYLRSRGANSAVDQISVHLRLARSRAVLEGNPYFVQFVDGRHYVIVDDDGGGEGLPGAPGYVATNRGNQTADPGERVLGPFELPEGVLFGAAVGSTNPFTNAALGDPVSFPKINNMPTVVFNPNGTTDNTGYIAVAPAAEVAHGSRERTTVLQVLRSTGSVQAQAVTGG